MAQIKSNFYFSQSIFLLTRKWVVFFCGVQSSNSSTTLLVSKTSRKPLSTWTCFWGGLTRFSFGWSQRCVCVLNSTRGCNFSRSSSRSPHSEWTSIHLSTVLCIHYSNLSFHVFCKSCKEYRNMNAFFAVIMGLSNPAVSRLSQTWEVSYLFTVGVCSKWS